ncbi:MAG: cell division protein FtsQ/DivIB [Gammaproteobacteria bacterium]
MPRKSRRKSPARPWLSFSLPQLKWRSLINGALLMLTGVGAWAGSTWLMEQPINSVRVEGSFERVPAMQIEAAVMPYINGGELSASLADLRRILIDLPWVQDASVRRSWPSTLNIQISEEQAAARWGKQGLLNVYGDLFVENSRHIPAELPQLDGPAGTELELAQKFFSLNTQLEQRGLNAVALKMDDRGSLTLNLNNGMEVRFGSVALDERANRFFLALDKVLTPVADKIDYIDMRYTNGFAVGWNPAAEFNLADMGDFRPHG